MSGYELSLSGLFLPREKPPAADRTPWHSGSPWYHRERVYILNPEHMKFAIHNEAPVKHESYHVRVVLQSGNHIRFYEYVHVVCPADWPGGFETLSSYEHGRNSCDRERMLKLWFRGDGPVEFEDVDDSDDPCTDGLVSVLSLKVNGCEMLPDGPI